MGSLHNIIMSDGDEDLNSLKSRITKIEEEAENTLPEKEQALIYIATSISKYTLEYWLNNFEKWYQLLSSTQKSSIKIMKAKQSFSWKSVGKNDVAGGIGGAVGAGVATLFGPIGWAGWGGAIIGGAAGSSAYDAAMQLMK